GSRAAPAARAGGRRRRLAPAVVVATTHQGQARRPGARRRCPTEERPPARGAPIPALPVVGCHLLLLVSGMGGTRRRGAPSCSLPDHMVRPRSGQAGTGEPSPALPGKLD